MPKYAGRAIRRPSIRRAGAARDVVVRVTQDGTRTSPVSEIAITAPSPRRALEACDRALAIDESAGKAWFRRGQACMHLEQYPAAQKNLHRAATLLPSSKEVRDELSRCQAKLAERKASGML